MLQIVRGEPSDDEVAALIAVLTMLAGATAAGPPTPHSTWAHPSRGLRTPLHPGPGAWRVSTLPSGRSYPDGHCTSR